MRRAIFFTRPELVEDPTEREDVVIFTEGSWQRRSFSRAVGQSTDVQDAIFARGEFFAAGRTSKGVAIWYSRDGLMWKQAEIPRANSFGSTPGIHIAHGPNGWIALIAGARKSWSIHSADGHRWDRPRSIAKLQIVEDLIAGDSGYLAVGSSLEFDQEFERARAWVSQDGLSWFQVLESREGTHMHAAAGVDKSFVGIGSDDGAPTIWSASQPGHWITVRACLGQLESMGGGSLYSIVGGAAGWLAVGAGGPALFSSNGQDWTQLHLKFEDGRPAAVTDAVVVGSQVLVVSGDNGLKVGSLEMPSLNVYAPK